MKKHSQYVLRPGTGRTIPQASVLVRPSPSTSIVGGKPVWNGITPAAVVYADRNGDTTLAQPFLASEAGKVEFYAPNGRYDIYVTYETISYVDTDVSVYDPLGDLASAPNDERFVVGAASAQLTNEIVISSFLGHPDQLPGAPHAMDDEFNVNLSGWSNFGTMDLREVLNSHLHLKHTTAATSFPVGLVRNFSEPSNYKVTAKLELGYNPGIAFGEMSGDRPIFGFGLRTNLNEILLVGLRASAQEISVCQVVYDAVSLVSADTFHAVGNSAYIQLERKGADYLLNWSQLGRSWVTAQQKAKTSLLSGLVTQLVFLTHPLFATGGGIDCYADFIRHS